MNYPEWSPKFLIDYIKLYENESDKPIDYKATQQILTDSRMQSVWKMLY